MFSLFGVVVGTIVASTLVALLSYKRSEMTLSEIAEKLDVQKDECSCKLGARFYSGLCEPPPMRPPNL
jgi:hypothetical protein